MPSKSHRDKLKTDPSNWNLPPDKLADPLPLSRNTKAPKSASRKKAKQDDTPRAFSRLFQPYRPPRAGQDDGSRPSKKRKTTSSTTIIEDPTANKHLDTIPKPTTILPPTQQPKSQPLAQPLQIQPNEPLSHFSARVDAALPFSTLTKTNPNPNSAPGNPTDPSLKKALGKPHQTKTEKKMQRMQRAWREEDQRRKERLEAEREEREGGVDEGGDGDNDGVFQGDKGGMTKKKGKKKKGGKKGKRKGEEEGEEDGDPWKELELKKKREESMRGVGDDGAGGLVGLHDVVTAPPEFHKKKARKGGEGGGGGGLKVKVKEGGLKRQVEVSEARRAVIEGYRAMMRQKREGVGIS